MGFVTLRVSVCQRAVTNRDKTVTSVIAEVVAGHIEEQSPGSGAPSLGATWLVRGVCVAPKLALCLRSCLLSMPVQRGYLYVNSRSLYSPFLCAT
jgi:hypothetical protein